MAYRSGRRGRACRPRGLCRYYMQGSCKKGPDCDFVHDPSRKQNMKGLCRYYMQGSCKKGPDCDFVHDPSRKQNIEYDNPNEAREGEEELPFSSRSDFTFVVGHGKCKLSKFTSKTLHIYAYLCMHGISRWKLFGPT